MASYGYPALILGTFLEGETILLAAGYLAHRGCLSLWPVIACAFIGSMAGDQLFFFLGRTRGRPVLARKRRWAEKVERVDRLLEKYRVWALLGFRFVYGIRTVTPVAVGLSRVPARVFAVCNAVGAFVWAAAVGCAGYLLGSALETVFGNLAHYEHVGLACILGAGIAVWVGYHVHSKRRSRRNALPDKKGNAKNPD